MNANRPKSSISCYNCMSYSLESCHHVNPIRLSALVYSTWKIRDTLSQSALVECCHSMFLYTHTHIGNSYFPSSWTFSYCQYPPENSMQMIHCNSDQGQKYQASQIARGFSNLIHLDLKNPGDRARLFLDCGTWTFSLGTNLFTSGASLSSYRKYLKILVINWNL